MKKIIFVGSLALIVNSFSFYAMKEIRCDDLKGIKYIPDEWKDLPPISPNPLALYDSHTGNMIVQSEKIDYIIGFKRLNISLKSYEETRLLGTKEGSIIKDPTYEGIPSTKIILSLVSKSGVRVKNSASGVTLVQGKKSIDLKQALKTHFASMPREADVKNTFVDEFINNIKKEDDKLSLSNKKLIPEVYKLNAPSISDEAVNLLECSDILSVYKLLPGEIQYNNEPEKVMESQMVGLAANKRTGKLFYWTTDLGTDISTLMKKDVPSKPAEERLVSASGVTIKKYGNQGIFLERGGSSMRLDHALEEYFDFMRSATLIRNNLNGKILEEKYAESLNLLTNCEILCVWFLISEETESYDKSKKIVTFRIIGSAKDNTNCKEFDWIANFGKDISNLTEYFRQF